MSDWIHLNALIDIEARKWRPTFVRKSSVVAFYVSPYDWAGAILVYDGMAPIFQETVDEVAVLLGAAAAVEAADPRYRELLSTLQLKTRARKCLQAAGIETIGQLLAKQVDQLLEIRNFGSTTLDDVNEALRAKGMRLRGY